MPILRPEHEIFPAAIFAVAEPCRVAHVRGRQTKASVVSLVSVAAVFLFAANASAQLVTDEVPRERTVPRSEEIRRDLAETRFRFGPVRLQPIFGLRDTGYDNNVFGTPDNPVSDWRSTVSAGADLILPLGRKLYVTGIVNPQYTYYNKVTNRRLFGGQYGGTVLALFNRLSIEAGGTQEKVISQVNSELERAAPGTFRDVFARTELEIFRRLVVFGSAQQQQQRYLSVSDPGQEIDLSLLERNSTFVRGGVGYRLRSYMDVTLSEETGRTEFVTARQSDNTTKATLLGVRYDRPRFFLNLLGGWRTLEPLGASSTFPRNAGATGSYYAAYQLGAPVAIDVYGHRSAVYGLYTASPYFIETRNAIGLTLPIRQRLGLRAFTEVGSNAYPVALAGSVRRRDDVTMVGGGITYRVYRKSLVTVTASQVRYDSNFPDFNRSVFRLATFVSFTGDSFR